MLRAQLHDCFLTKYVRDSISSLKQVWIPSHSLSNVPLVFFISKICLGPGQFPIFLETRTFRTSRFGWRTSFPKYLAQIGFLLHLVGSLNQFRIQWFENTDGHGPIWKYLLVTYCVILFAVGPFILQHIDKVQTDVGILLNSDIEVETTLHMQRR